MTHPARWVATLAMLALVTSALPISAAAEAPLPAPAAGFPGVPGGALDSVPDIPAGPAVVHGRVLREGASTGIGGIPVVLYALRADGSPGLRTLVTDEAGSFAFESVANDPATVYLLGASFAEIPFGTRFSFEPGELERQIDLPVSDATSDTRGAEVGEVQIEIERGCANLSLRESHRLDNPGRQTLYVPEAEREGREPILRVTLPADAVDLQSELGDDLERDGDRLAFWGPLRPGHQKIEFSYGIPARGEAFEIPRSFPSGAGRLVLLDHPGGPSWTRSGPEDSTIARGDSTLLGVEPAAADGASALISVPDARFWLELDGAALTVEQQYTLAVEADGPLLSEGGAPLFCLAMPERADGLRFSSEILAMGLSRDPSGALAVRGPVPVGETAIALRYLLPIEQSDPLFSQVMPLDVSLLSVLVADTGLVVETSRLHRKRPARTADRSYLHLEAFELPAGESVELRLRPLAARKSLPMPAATGAAFAVAALAIGFLIAPLRRSGSETSVPPSAASRAADQRASVLTAIHGLDEDFEIGKLSEADHREMRQTLRAEAVALLRAERAALAASSGADRAEDLPARSCPRCGVAVGEAARFCSQCGAPLGERPAADGAERV